jgi:hypothetical protein
MRVILYVLLLSFIIISSGYVYAQPANDNCAGAINITVPSPVSCTAVGTSGFSSAYSSPVIVDFGHPPVAAATNSTTTPAPPIAAPCNWNATRPDVWYRFTVPAGAAGVQLNASNYAENTPGSFATPSLNLQLYQGTTCGSLTLVSPQSGNGGCNQVFFRGFGVTMSQQSPNIKLGPLTAGQTYYLRLFNTTAKNDFRFDLRLISLPPPPANENCAAATPITPAGGCNYGPLAESSWQNQAPSDIPVTCTGGTWYTVDNPIYFRVRATSTSFSLTINSVVCNSSAGGGFAQFALFRNCAAVGTYTPTTGPTANFFGCAVGSGTITLSSTIDASLVGQDLILVVDGDFGDNCRFGITGTNVILPVRLSSFTGFYDPATQQTTLIWHTEKEINNQHFIIERSTDGINFQPIGIVPGNGTTQEIQAYEFIDKSPAFGRNYYQLRQVDFNGEISFGNIVAITRPYQGLNIQQIGPNPATAELYIKLTTEEKTDLHFELLDMMGKQVSSSTVSTEVDLETAVTIGMTQLSPGIYHLRIQDLNTGKQLVRTIQKY